MQAVGKSDTEVLLLKKDERPLWWLSRLDDIQELFD